MPSSASRAKSVGTLSTGVWSNLKSPVWMTSPTGVCIAMPVASGMLWHTWKNSAVNAPKVNVSPGSMTCSSAAERSRWSRSFTSMRPWASRGA